MVRALNLKEFSKKFSYNEHRKHLFNLFVEELESVKAQCASMRVLIFGSYITSKKKPGDIDVLISLIPNKDCVYRIVTRGLQHRHPKEVDIHYYKTQRYIKDAEGLIRHFNKNRINELKGVIIKKAVEIKDISD